MGEANTSVYPILIISKGRPGNVFSQKDGTSNLLAMFHIPHYIMVEPQEEELYNKYKNDYATILTIPQEQRDMDTKRMCDWTNYTYKSMGNHQDWMDTLKMGRGAVASRDSTKAYARDVLHAKAFWNMDDNSCGFWKWVTKEEVEHYDCEYALQGYGETDTPSMKKYGIPGWKRNLERLGIAKVSWARFKPGVDDEKVRQIFFYDFQPNLWKLDNLGFIGYNSVDACPVCVKSYFHRPLGRRVYSCTLMRTDYPYEWWGQTSDDVLLNLDALEHGWWMACLWRWVMGKPLTQTMGGGCTVDAYGHEQQSKGKGKEELINSDAYPLSTLPKSSFIYYMKPQYLRVRPWKRRVHHNFLWDECPHPHVKIDLSNEEYNDNSKTSLDSLYKKISSYTDLKPVSKEAAVDPMNKKAAMFASFASFGPVSNSNKTDKNSVIEEDTNTGEYDSMDDN